jgi:hypothetical protein
MSLAGLTVLDGTYLVVIAGCVQTIVVRLMRILRALREKDAAASATKAASDDEHAARDEPPESRDANP